MDESRRRRAATAMVLAGLTLAGCGARGAVPLAPLGAAPAAEQVHGTRRGTKTIYATVGNSGPSMQTGLLTYAGTGAYLGQISDGLQSTSGIAVDGAGNVYVGNEPGWVVIYPPGSPLPGGVHDVARYGILLEGVAVGGKLLAIALATNSHLGTVSSATHGVVIEYRAGVPKHGGVQPRRVIALPAGEAAWRVAFDRTGNLYVQYQIAGSSTGYIARYTPGSDTPTTLPMRFASFGGGFGFDAAGNLVACDTGRTSIDVFAPAKKTFFSRTPARTIDISPYQCYDIAFDATGHTLYATTATQSRPSAGIAAYAYATGKLQRLFRDLPYGNLAFSGIAVSPPLPN